MVPMDLIQLFTVEEAFQLSGRPGPVLVPGIPDRQDLPTIRIGSRIRLVSPDGQCIDTEIAGVEMVNYGRRPVPTTIYVPISLPSSISKQQVPSGTKVYLIDAERA